jgi:hypothetical protein
MSASPAWLRTLVSRYDPGGCQEPGQVQGVRLAEPDEGAWEVVLADGRATIGSSAGRPHALISAEPDTWGSILADPHAAIDAYLAGRLSVRRNLHVGVGFLAATSGATGPARMRFRFVSTRRAHSLSG